jgi:hypothetical protein
MDDGRPGLPVVQWGKHRISRLLAGHDQLLGHAHISADLSEAMREWFEPAKGHDLELLRRCEELGINTVQFGHAPMHDLLRRYKAEGGNMQWIATWYGDEPGAGGVRGQEGHGAELASIAGMDPQPIGITHFGSRTDRKYLEGKMGDVWDMLKRFRDTGLLVGMTAHTVEALEYAVERDWDVDFLQCCFYTVYVHLGTKMINRAVEKYDDADRERMARFIAQVDKPCIAYKVLAAGKKCSSEAEVRSALEFACTHIKDTDVVLVGMWQKEKDQVAQNVRWVSEFLA